MGKRDTKNESEWLKQSAPFLSTEPHPILVAGVIISYTFAIVALLGFAEPLQSSYNSPISVLILFGGCLVSICLVIIAHQKHRIHKLMHENHRARQQVRRILKTSPQGIIEIDERGSIVVFSESAGDLFGYHPNYILGKDLSLLFPNTQENVLLYQGYLNTSAPTTQSPEQSAQLVLTALHRNGIALQVSLSLSQFMLEGASSRTTIAIDANLKIASEPVRPTCFPQESIRILLVEDEATPQCTTAALLESQGYRVVVADNREEAIELFERHSFDLVVMDMAFPAGDGSADLPLLQQNTRSGRVPIITLRELSEESASSALPRGVSTALNKPVDSNKLFQTIQNLTDRAERLRT